MSKSKPSDFESYLRDRWRTNVTSWSTCEHPGCDERPTCAAYLSRRGLFSFCAGHLPVLNSTQEGERWNWVRYAGGLESAVLPSARLGSSENR